MKVLILASSPLHLINSILLSQTYSNWCITLIFIGKFRNRSQFFSHALNSWEFCPFEHVKITEINHHRDAVHLLNAINYDLVVTGNDLLPEFNILSQACHSKKIKMAFMDDGLFSYIEYDKKKPNPTLHKLRNIGRKVVGRASKQYPFTIGNSPLTSATYLLYPDKKKRSLDSKLSYSLISHQKRPLYTEIFSRFSKHCIQSTTLTELSSKQCQLLIMPHHKRLTSQLMTQLNESTKLYETTVIKNHPSNRKEDIDSLLNEHCIEAPQELPAELLLPLLKPLVITGGISSIFLYAQELFPDIKINIISDTDTDTDTDTQKIFESLTVEKSNIEELLP